MQNLATVAATAGGLFFSVVCGILIEEMFFGVLFKTFFSRQPKDPQKH